MISTQQIKAARALLNWKQSDLAEASGVSIPAIAKIEMGTANPRQATMDALSRAFENAGLEFLGNHGVDQRQEKFSIEVMNGAKSITRVWDDINRTYHDKGGELLLGNLDERIYLKLYGKQMRSVFHKWRELNITARALVKDDENFFLMPLECHRAIPKMLFSQIVYYVYADKLVIADFKETPRFIMVQSKSMADAFRQQFEFNWSIGKKIDPKKATLWQL